MKNTIASLLALVLLAACGPQQEAPKPAVPVKAAPAKPANYTTIGLKPDQFKTAFNSAAEADKSSFRILALDVKPGAGGPQFAYAFDTNISTLGTVNEFDGTIRSLTTMAMVVGTKESATKVPLIMHALVRATNPTLPAQDSAGIALGLFQKAVANTDTPYEEVRNGIRYAAQFIRGAGMMFVVDQKR